METRSQRSSRPVECCPQIWSYNDQAQRWDQEPPLTGGHSDWVRDVAWAPSLGMPFHTIASAGQVRTLTLPLTIAPTLTLTMSWPTIASAGQVRVHSNSVVCECKTPVVR